MSEAIRTVPAVTLNVPDENMCEEFLAAVRASRSLHRPWAYPPDSPAAFRDYLARLQRTNQLGYLIMTAEGNIAGVINVSEIVLGAFRSAYLGYYGMAPTTGRGYMSAGMKKVITRAFEVHGLHRLEANIQPKNLASRRLVDRLGFRLEGFSPRYLKIGGRWRDHERWAITREEWPPR